MMRYAPVVFVAALVVVPHILYAQAMSDPVPIPGGIHVFAPGPRGLKLQGLDVEPSTITDFDGDVALAYVFGKATDGNGHAYDLKTDMRVFRGEYVSADGVHREGAFGFV
jgi:hypothetical protein